jgi:hypothetical protein
MVSSNQKGFKVFCAERGRASRASFTKTRTPPESALEGVASREPSFGDVRRAFCYGGSVSEIHGRAKSSSRNELVGFGWEARRDESDRRYAARARLIQKDETRTACLSRRSSRNVVLWDFCDTWRIFLPDHIAGRFSCSNVTIRTRRGACAWVSRRFY